MAAKKKAATEAPVRRKKRVVHESSEVEQDAPAETPSVKPGRKRRSLTTDERLDRLEALHAALVVKLRPHGIHLQSPDERETQAEVQAGHATPAE